ncbi:MAG: sulfurtransferase TusA family protein [Chlamydiia bacterium]|nr:sulfurtransferase TusA family protein [Chlamydiia bacterium]
MKFDKEIDLRGKACPLPIALSKVELGKLKSGQTMLVVTDDCSAELDFKAWAQQSNEIFDLLSQEEERVEDHTIQRHVLRKK